MSVGPGHYAVLSAVIFSLGIFGLLLRPDPAGMLTGAVLLTVGPVVALAGFTHAGQGSGVGAAGDALAFVALVAMAGEVLAAGGLALLVWRRLRGAGLDPLIDADL